MGVTKKYHIRNVHIHSLLNVQSIKDFMNEYQLKWYSWFDVKIREPHSAANLGNRSTKKIPGCPKTILNSLPQ